MTLAFNASLVDENTGIGGQTFGIEAQMLDKI
jgi:hypothetical protein